MILGLVYSVRWSANLAYIVGLIATDGNLSKDGRHINLTSKDILQLETFAKILNLSNKISPKMSSYAKNNICYQIQFGNVKLYKFLQSIGLTPNKTKTIGELSIPKRYFADFLRGHLDGDGCTYSYWDTRWKSSFMLYTDFISASKKHLDWLRNKVLNLYGIEGKIGFSGRSTYKLVYAKHASVWLLNMIYYRENIPCLKRKRLKISKALGIIQQQDAEVLESVDRLA